MRLGREGTEVLSRAGRFESSTDTGQQLEVSFIDNTLCRRETSKFGEVLVDSLPEMTFANQQFPESQSLPLAFKRMGGKRKLFPY